MSLGLTRVPPSAEGARWAPSPHFSRQAFSKRGMPVDQEVFPKASPFIARHEDIWPDEDLEGQDLQVSCCAANPRNVCKATLAEPVRTP